MEKEKIKMTMTTEDVLAQLDPRIRKNLTNGEGIRVEYQPTPSHGRRN